MDHLCYSCLVFVMLSRLFIAALRSSEGKRLTYWLLFVMLIVILLPLAKNRPLVNIAAELQ